MSSGANTTVFEPNKPILEWIKRFNYFNDRKHPKDLGTGHISAFLTHYLYQQSSATHLTPSHQSGYNH